MMKVRMIRHGKTEGNLVARYIGTTDEPLCQEGILDALERQVPDAQVWIYSPMRRCVQTMYLLLNRTQQGLAEDSDTLVARLREAHPQIRFVCEPELRECDFGLFENKNYKELDGCREYQEWIDSNGTLPFPGGESPEGFKERSAQAFAAQILRESAAGTQSVNLCVHGGTIMSIMDRFAVDAGCHTYYDWHVSNCCGFSAEASLCEGALTLAMEKGETSFAVRTWSEEN